MPRRVRINQRKLSPFAELEKILHATWQPSAEHAPDSAEVRAAGPQEKPATKSTTD